MDPQPTSRFGTEQLRLPSPTPGERSITETEFAQLRDGLGRAGDYLFVDESGAVRVVALDGEWTRIGRSLAADIRFDDPTVSRRHALIVRRAEGTRVLDDRSLNGVFVNGERIEWRELSDGDEIIVGRYRLHFVRVTPTERAAVQMRQPLTA